MKNVIELTRYQIQPFSYWNYFCSVLWKTTKALSDLYRNFLYS